jgi:hypothetical protein
VRIFILIIILIYFYIISFAFATHNQDPKNPITLIDRGYNKKNCESLIGKKSKQKGLWLGHLIGCQLDDVIIQEFKVIKAPARKNI